MESAMISPCGRPSTVLCDILNAHRHTSDILWAGQPMKFNRPYNIGKNISPCQIKSLTISSLDLEKFIKNRVSSKDEEEKVKKEVELILEEIAFDFNLPMLRSLGVCLIKIFKKTLTGIFVNSARLQEIRSSFGEAPVIFVPTHRSYADFIVMAFVTFHFHIEIPCVAAGIDFLNMKVMGPVLRKCKAFFMRRRFLDPTYAKVFSIYLQSIILYGSSPIEFFIEGTRSRSGKSVSPKFGLLTMIMDLFYSGKVPDLLFVPVNISYDRILEESLFATEHLGVPKPKESTKGFFKSLKIVSENYGRMFIDFGEPIKARSFIPRKINFDRRSPTQERIEIYSLGYKIVERQRAMQTSSIINLLAILLNNQFINEGIVKYPLVKVMEDLEWLVTVITSMGGAVFINESIATSFKECLLSHQNFIACKDNHLYVIDSINQVYKVTPLRSVKGAPLNERTLSQGAIYIRLQIYINPLIDTFLGSSLIVTLLKTFSLHSPVREDELFQRYVFLCHVFQHEFVFTKGQEHQGFSIAMDYLRKIRIIDENDGCITYNPADYKFTTLVSSMLNPYIAGYYALCSVILEAKGAAMSTIDVMKESQIKIEKELNRGNFHHYYSLSLDLLNCALCSFTAMGVLIKFNGEKGMLYKPAEDASPNLRGLQVLLGTLLEETRCNMTKMRKDEAWGDILKGKL